MDMLYAHCAGIDVHKQTVVVCVRHGGSPRREEVRTFGTATRELLALSAWLTQEQVTHVAMESTGVYWQPVWNILEGSFVLVLANAGHIKNLPGRKTDVKDCQWIAELLAHGLIKGSLVPERGQRELRDLTRMRTSLVQERVRVANRIQKVLEQANIKLASVASDVLGASGRDMLQALVDGKTDAAAIAELARCRLRAKIPELREALTGRVTEHHRFLLGFLLGQVARIEEQLATLDARIEQVLTPCQQEVVTRLDTMPGFDRRAAQALLAEIGTDMEHFGTAERLSAWAGMCPGNHQSGGKRKAARCPDGNRWLRGLLTQTGWAASHTKATYFTGQYHRLVKRRGKKRAVLALGHSQLVIAFHLIRDGGVYEDLGPDHLDKLQGERKVHYLTKRLRHMGYHVTLTPAA